MGNFRIFFFMSEGAYRTGVVAYKVDLGRTTRAYAVSYAKTTMNGSSFYCYEIEEYWNGKLSKMKNKRGEYYATFVCARWKRL